MQTADAIPAQFRLQYAEKTSTCEAVSTWTNAADTGGAWEVMESTLVTDGTDTTNIANETQNNTYMDTPIVEISSGKYLKFYQDASGYQKARVDTYDGVTFTVVSLKNNITISIIEDEG